MHALTQSTQTNLKINNRPVGHGLFYFHQWRIWFKDRVRKTWAGRSCADRQQAARSVLGAAADARPLAGRRREGISACGALDILAPLFTQKKPARSRFCPNFNIAYPPDSCGWNNVDKKTKTKREHVIVACFWHNHSPTCGLVIKPLVWLRCIFSLDVVRPHERDMVRQIARLHSWILNCEREVCGWGFDRCDTRKVCWWECVSL